MTNVGGDTRLHWMVSLNFRGWVAFIFKNRTKTTNLSEKENLLKNVLHFFFSKNTPNLAASTDLGTWEKMIQYKK